MYLGPRISRSRCLAVWLFASGGLALVVLLTRRPVAAGWTAVTGGAPGATPLDAALTQLAAVVLVGCTGWMWLVTSLVVLEAARGPEDASRRLPAVPRTLRRAVLAACGVALAGGLAEPGVAVPPQAHGVHAPPRTGHHRPRLTGLPLPDRAVAPPPGHARRLTHPPRTVRVSPGDTLWSIAAGELPRGSSDARVTARWHAIYAANRSLIGPDPDAIMPGQRLLLPGKDPS